MSAYIARRIFLMLPTLLGILFTNLAVGAVAAFWVLRATAPATAATLRPARTEEEQRHAA